MSYSLLERRDILKPLTKNKTFSERNDTVIKSVYDTTAEYYKFELEPLLSLSIKAKANYVDIIRRFMNAFSDCVLGETRKNPEPVTEKVEGKKVEITPLKDLQPLTEKDRLLLEDLDALLKAYLHTKSLSKIKSSILYNDVVDFLNEVVERLQ
jgi:hypothetical protein